MRPYRKERVASLIQEIISEAIVRKLSDPRIAPLTTVSRVEMSTDLTVANVFVTVTGETKAETETLLALRHACGFVQRIVAKELTMRQCPEIRFKIDETMKKVKATMRLLDANRKDLEAKDAMLSHPDPETPSLAGDEMVGSDEAAAAGDEAAGGAGARRVGNDSDEDQYSRGQG